MSVGDVIFTVLNMIASHDFGYADVVVAFPLVEGYFAEEFLFVVFELSHGCCCCCLLRWRLVCDMMCVREIVVGDVLCVLLWTMVQRQSEVVIG